MDPGARDVDSAAHLEPEISGQSLVALAGYVQAQRRIAVFGVALDLGLCIVEPDDRPGAEQSERHKIAAARAREDVVPVGIGAQHVDDSRAADAVPVGAGAALCLREERPGRTPSIAARWGSPCIKI